MPNERIVRMSVEIVNEDGSIVKAHTATRMENGTYNHPKTNAIAGVLSDCLVAMTLDSPRPFGIPVLSSRDADAGRDPQVYDERREIIFEFLRRLPRIESPDWQLLHRLADAEKELGGQTKGITLKVERAE